MFTIYHGILAIELKIIDRNNNTFVVGYLILICQDNNFSRTKGIQKHKKLMTSYINKSYLQNRYLLSNGKLSVVFLEIFCIFNLEHFEEMSDAYSKILHNVIDDDDDDDGGGGGDDDEFSKCKPEDDDDDFVSFLVSFNK